MSNLKQTYKQFFTELQKSLKAHGLWAGPVDGVWSGELDEAIRAFKRANGFRPDRSLIGPMTLDALESTTAAPITTITNPNYPVWLNVALSYVGLTEIPGPTHNQTIVEWWQYVGVTWYDDDETPWCALFIAAILKEAGFPILPASQVASALAWKSYGQDLVGPALGAIAIKHRNGRSSGQGHIGLIAGRTSDHKLALVSGNANNRVGVDEYEPGAFDYYRYPTGIIPKIGMSHLPVVRVSGDRIVSEA